MGSAPSTAGLVVAAKEMSQQEMNDAIGGLHAENVAKLKRALAASAPAPRGRVLIVATSAAKLGDHDTGAWSEEVCGPYFTFADAGYEVSVCSIAGGDVPIDAGSLSEQFKTDNDKRMIEEGCKPLKGTAKLAEQDPAAFDVCFFAGGHGTCMDFPTDEVGDFISKAVAAGKVVAAVCHGPMALVKAKGKDGEPLVKGKKVSVFSDVEEGLVGLTEKVPFLLEAKMKELGAEVDVAGPWSDKATRDGNLVTGQNPQSSVSVAKLAIEALRPARSYKVCVVGGAGGIGQPLCMLMASHPDVGELCVYDLAVSMVPADGVAADLSHINTKCTVRGFSFEVGDKAVEKAGECLTGCHLVLVPAGMPRKPGMDRKDLLKVNADIAKNIVEACAKHCPEAVVALIVNPVNSVVPAMCELWKKKGLSPTRIVGVTTLDVLRANKFVHEVTGAPVEEIEVPIVGGHAGSTILPLFSQDKAAATIPAEQIPDLDKRVQDAGTVVVEKKAGKGSATLSMAFAGARLGRAVLAGLSGEEATECAYVASTVTDVPYFATKVTFGPEGVKTVHPMGTLSAHEQARLDEMLPTLREEVQAGLDYAASNEFAF